MEKNLDDDNRSECPDFNTLAAYLDDSLDEKEKQGVDSHLRSCQRCREIFNFGELTRQSQVALDNTQPQSNDLDPLFHKLIPFGQLSTGQTVGRYIIVNPLGLGGMGEVYSAYDPELNRRVALKLLRTDVFADATQDKNVSRLMKEAQAMAQLSHPNVISIYDVMKIEGRVVIAMEYFSGGTLKSWLQDQNRNWREIVDKFVLAGRGLAAAHAANLVHRDFKPANVLLEQDGRVCVTDFGLVRGLHQDEGPESSESLAPSRLEESLTISGSFVGTPAYMSPEQLRGEKSDTRSDQFCFCVGLFEALYGKRPYPGDTPAELIQSVQSGQISPVEPTSKVPSWLYDIVKQGLAISPEDRYPSMVELLQDLENDPIEIAKQKRAVQNRKLIVIFLVLLAILLPLGVWYGLQYRRVQLCKDTSGEFVGIWDNPTKEAVRAAFVGTKKSFAQDTWERVERVFDKYLAEWVQMRSDICEAKHVRGTQSEELFDLRMSCLKERKQELQALVKIFAEADAKVVEKAVQASSSLAALKICADEKALRAPYPPPSTEEMKAKVAAIRAKLDQAKALDNVGKFQEGLKLSELIEQEAKTIGYEPVYAEALYWLGNEKMEVADYESAVELLQKAAFVADKSRHDNVRAYSLSSLLFVLGDRLARFDEALKLNKRVEAAVQRLGDRAIELDWYNSLGNLFNTKGDYEKASFYLRKALRMSERDLGPNHLAVAIHMNNLGNVLESQGKADEALKNYGRALAIREKTLGPKHPLVATCLNNIGFVLELQGKYEEALEYYRRAMTIWKKALGPEHLDVATSLNNIGVIFKKQNKYDKALENYRKALAIRERALGPEHPLVATSLNNIGMFALYQGEYIKAGQYFHRALVIREKVLGPSHTSVADTLMGLGMVDQKQGKNEKALHYQRRALAILEEALGPDHANVAFPMVCMGDIFKNQNKLGKALAYNHRALTILEKQLGPKHPVVAVPLSGIGNVLIAQGKPRQAIPPLERVLAICEKKTCETEAFGIGLYNLARALMSTNADKDRAIRLATRALEVLGKNPKLSANEIKEVKAWRKNLIR